MLSSSPFWGSVFWSLPLWRSVTSPQHCHHLNALTPPGSLSLLPPNAAAAVGCCSGTATPPPSRPPSLHRQYYSNLQACEQEQGTRHTEPALSAATTLLSLTHNPRPLHTTFSPSQNMYSNLSPLHTAYRNNSSVTRNLRPLHTSFSPSYDTYSNLRPLYTTLLSLIRHV